MKLSSSILKRSGDFLIPLILTIPRSPKYSKILNIKVIPFSFKEEEFFLLTHKYYFNSFFLRKLVFPNKLNFLKTDLNDYKLNQKYFLSFEDLYQESRSLENSNISQDLLLKTYEKNQLRMFYWLTHDSTIGWYLEELLTIIKDRHDNDFKNRFFFRLKQWIDLDFFKKNERFYKKNWNDKISIKKILPNLDKLIIETIESLNPQNENIKETKFNKPVHLSNYFDTIFYLSKIRDTYHFLLGLNGIKNEFLLFNFYESHYLYFFKKEILLDTSVLFKISNASEAWIYDIQNLNKIYLSQLKILFNTLKISENFETLMIQLSKELIKPSLQENSKLTNVFNYLNYLNLFEKFMLDIYLNPSEIVISYTTWIKKIIHEMVFNYLDSHEILNLNNTKSFYFNKKYLNLLKIFQDYLVLMEYKPLYNYNTIKHLLKNKTEFLFYFLNKRSKNNNSTERILKFPEIEKINQELEMSFITPQIVKFRNFFFNYFESKIYYQRKEILKINHLLKISRKLKFVIATDHTKLIISIAKNQRYGSLNYDTSDLIQEGLIGLTKAVERFQLELGYQFTTYATWWVHQGLNRAVNFEQNQMVLIPIHLQRKIQLIKSTAKYLEKKNKNYPSIEEVAKELNLTSHKIYQLLENVNISKKILSLDQKISFKDTRDYLTLISKNNTKNLFISTNLLEIINHSLVHLDSRDSTILKMRIGFGPYKKHTLEQVAKIFSVNREKIKTIEKDWLIFLAKQFSSEKVNQIKFISFFKKYLMNKTD